MSRAKPKIQINKMLILRLLISGSKYTKIEIVNKLKIEYGYEIRGEITNYLYRLEQEKNVRIEKEYDNGQERNLYSITPQGKKTYAVLTSDYFNTINKINKIVGLPVFSEAKEIEEKERLSKSLRSYITKYKKNVKGNGNLQINKMLILRCLFTNNNMSKEDIKNYLFESGGYVINGEIGNYIDKMIMCGEVEKIQHKEGSYKYLRNYYTITQEGRDEYFRIRDEYIVQVNLINPIVNLPNFHSI